MYLEGSKRSDLVFSICKYISFVGTYELKIVSKNGGCTCLKLLSVFG